MGCSTVNQPFWIAQFLESPTWPLKALDVLILIFPRCLRNFWMQHWDPPNGIGIQVSIRHSAGCPAARNGNYWCATTTATLSAFESFFELYNSWLDECNLVPCNFHRLTLLLGKLRRTVSFFAAPNMHLVNLGKSQLFSRDISCLFQVSDGSGAFYGCLWFIGNFVDRIFVLNCAAGANPLDSHQNDSRPSGRAARGITCLKGSLGSLIPHGQLFDKLKMLEMWKGFIHLSIYLSILSNLI